MPPRLESLGIELQSLQLFVLPFLAPRIFKPWPSSCRRFRANSPSIRTQWSIAASNISGGHNGCRQTLQNHGTKGHLRCRISHDTTSSRSGFPIIEPYMASESTYQKVRACELGSKVAHKSGRSGTAIPKHALSSDTTFLPFKRPDFVRKKRATIRHSSGWDSKKPSRIYASIRKSERKLGIDDHDQFQANSTLVNSTTKQNSFQLASNLKRIALKRSAYPQSRKLRNSEDQRWSQLMSSLELIQPEMGIIHRRIVQCSPSRSRISICRSFLDDLVQHKSADSLKESWSRFPLHVKKVLWPEIMFATLAHHPHKALDVLEVITRLPIRRVHVPEVIQYILTYHLQISHQHSKYVAQDITTRICNLLLAQLPGHPPLLTQKSVFMMLQTVPPNAIKDFYWTLKTLKQTLSHDTSIQFASRLAKSGETDLAFDILKTFQNPKTRDMDKVLSLCSTIMTELQRNEDPRFGVADVFKHIHEAGIIPNIITYNVLILDAVRSANYETAWKIHDMMIDIGITTDSFTYSILFNDAKLRMDLSAMKKVMDLVSKQNINDAYIFTDVLHAIYGMSIDSNRSTTSGPVQSSEARSILRFGPAFDRMLQLYSERFQIEPLVRVIPQLKDVVSPSSNPDILRPTRATIAVMVTAYLYFSHASGVKQFYNHFRSLVLSGDPAVQDLMHEAYIYNIIMWIFGRHAELRSTAPMILKDMLTPALTAEKGAMITRGRGSDKELNTADCSVKDLLQQHHTPPDPNVYTWSILMHIFMIQGHTIAAEEILVMMERRGVKPTLVTWNVLLSGYSSLQDIARTADAMQRLQDSGFTPNDMTYKSLNKLHDQGSLENHMAKQKLVVDAVFVKQLEQRLRASQALKAVKEVGPARAKHVKWLSLSSSQHGS